MEFLRFLFVIFLFNNFHCYATSYSGNQEFAVGEEYWEPSKQHYHSFVAGQFRERHARYVGQGYFNQVLELERTNTLPVPVSFTLENVLDGINLEFQVCEGGVTQLQLFLAFNEAIVEIFDIGTTVFTKAEYIRSDLNKAKDYSAQVVTFLNGVQHISQYLFKGIDNDFNEEKCIKSLNKASHISAESLQSRFNSYIKDMKRKQQAIISLEQYIEFHTDLYSKVFTSQYFFLKAHLISQEPKAKLFLDRERASGLDKFKCNLTIINLLKTITPDLKEEDTMSAVQVSGNGSEPTKKHKKKRKKKKRETQAKIEVPQTTDQLSSSSSIPLIFEADTKEELPSTSSISTPVEDNFQNDQIFDDPLSPKILEVPFIIGNEILPEKSLIGSSLTTPSETSTPIEAHFQNDQSFDNPLSPEISEVPFIIGNETLSEKSLIESSLPTTSEAPQIKEKKKEKKKEVLSPTHQVKQTVSQMQKLNILLNEHDGGPTAGMKTRKFLRLCAALHENGFLSEFSANKKEAYVKVDSMASLMHVENHSAKRKSPGVSRNTAKKLQEIIEIIKNSIE